MAGGASEGDDGVVSGINVTPLVDITLVLLIIFMVTAKIIVSQSIPLDLPKAAKGEQIQLVFGVEISGAGDLVVDGKRIEGDPALLDAAKAAFTKNQDVRAVIRADSAVPHGRVIRVLDLLKQAGISKVAFGVTPISPEGGGAAPAPAPAPPSP